MAYRVTFKASAIKELDRLPKGTRERVLARVESLRDTPRPSGATKLQAANNLWRIRIGDYRVVYLIDDPHELVDVRIVAHRREVYRGL